MEKEIKVTEFFNSKGKTFEEIFEQPLDGEFMEEPKTAADPWWKTTIKVFRNKEVCPKRGED